MKRVMASTALSVIASVLPMTAQEKTAEPEKLAKVHFPVSCASVAQPITLRQMAVLAAASESAEKTVALYDPNPAHIWNRLYATLLVRKDRHGTSYGVDTLDPPLFFETEHLLEGATHAPALHLLDEFLHTHAENLVRDPVKRAILQRDLWTVFDWSVQQRSRSGRPNYDSEKRELQVRLAEALRRLALSPKEIERLPDNYAQAVAAGTFPKEYDPSHRDRAFLPPDLFDPRGPWVYINPSPDEFLSPGLAQAHVYAFSGRSRFLVFIRLREGRKATLAYLQTLWNFPQPWIQGQDPLADQAVLNPDLPSFPAGTEVALVRQMTIFDNQGNLTAAPITESVQLRVYRAITITPARFFERDWAEVIKNSGQDFYEIKLSRPLLFAGKDGGLRATGRDERELSTFQQQGNDEIDEFNEHPEFKRIWPPELQTCASCHNGGGVRSLNSVVKLFKPNRLQHDWPSNEDYAGRCWLDDMTETWKQGRYDWGLLTGYWTTGNSLH
jgi:hypothetical protein